MSIKRKMDNPWHIHKTEYSSGTKKEMGLGVWLGGRAPA
jgi:hypothetical protein